jgi:hypothetical protein
MGENEKLDTRPEHNGIDVAITKDGWMIAQHLDPKFAARVLACLEACERIPTENLKILAKTGGIGSLVETLMEEGYTCVDGGSPSMWDDEFISLRESDLKLLLPEDKNGKT